MKASSLVYHVDPFEFLALGALAQAPNTTMARKALLKHLRAICRIAGPAGVVGNLQAKGLVEVTEGRVFVRLNELGSLAHRDPGRDEIPSFMAVARDFFAEHWATD